MDVNSVLKNTRRYFQGIPSGSSAGAELGPAALAGYGGGGPPVSSAAATAVSAANPYPPYQRPPPHQHHQPPPNFAPNTWNAAPPPVAPNAAAYHPAVAPPPASTAASTPNGASSYSRPFAQSPYHMYEGARRSPKMLPTSSPSTFPSQHSYTAPSITRTNDSGGGMFNMDSIVCQSEVNHLQNKKTKIKQSPATVYKPQPTQQQQQQEESRFFSRGLVAPHGQQPAAHPAQPPAAAPVTASRLPSIVPSHISAPPTHHQQLQQSSNRQSYPASGAHFVQQQVGYQQVSYPSNTGSTVALHQTSVEKVSPREPADVQYYRCIETTTTVETTAPLVAKRDSPLDLSVKTIRQSADSTALDDAENAYGHFALAHHPHARHPHLPQLPYVSVAMSPRNHSAGAASAAYGSAANQARQPAAHYSVAPAAAYAEPPANFVVKNGQLRREDALGRHPVSEKMTVSITYEQKQQSVRTQVNAKVSAVSHYYPQEGVAKSNRPTLPVAEPSGSTAEQSQSLPPAASPAGLLSTKVSATISAAVSSRKRPSKYDEIPPSSVKSARGGGDWRENINKEIDNRINAYTAMKAREEEEERRSGIAANDGYRAEAPVSQPPKEPESRANSYQTMAPASKFSQQRPPSHSPKSPFSPYMEQKLQIHQQMQQQQIQRQQLAQHMQEQQFQQQPHKAQHKLPVQSVQMHHVPQQWYPTVNPPTAQRPYPSSDYAHSNRSASPYKAPVYQEAHPLRFSKSGFDGGNDLKIIEKIKNPKGYEEQETQPLPSFQHLPAMNFPPKSKPSAHQQLPSIDNRFLENRLDSNICRKEPKVATAADNEPQPRKDKSEHQSRESIRASVLAHPRFRTKAELKQVTPVDEINKICEDKLPQNVQSITSFSSRASLESESPKLLNSMSKTYDNSDSKMDVTDDRVYNHRPGSVDSVSESENLSRAVPSRSPSITDFNRQYSPRKRLFSKSEESVADVKRSSSETTVFEFRDSDSEPETSGSDLHSLNEMRKDRKTRAPSETPTIIEQLNEEHHLDDSHWLDACNELINQFAGGSVRKRGRKKKPIPIIVEDSSQDEEPPSPPRKQPALDQSLLSQVKREPATEPTSPVVPRAVPQTEIKKEKGADPQPRTLAEKPIPKTTRVKVEKSEETKTPEPPRTRSEERKQVADKECKPEMRGQRSNVGTTRIRIQNVLEDLSDSDEGSVPIAKRYGSKKQKLSKKPAAFKKALAKKLAQQQQRKLAASRKKLKMRHRILRRMETRKSKMEALAKAESDDNSPPVEEAPQQPIITRKMARRECQKEGCRREEESSPVVSPAKRAEKPSTKIERKTPSKEKQPEKVEKPSRGQKAETSLKVEERSRRVPKDDTSERAAEERSSRKGAFKENKASEEKSCKKPSSEAVERNSRKGASKENTAEASEEKSCKKPSSEAVERNSRKGASKENTSEASEEKSCKKSNSEAVERNSRKGASKENTAEASEEKSCKKPSSDAEERSYRRRPFKDKRRGRRRRYLIRTTNAATEEPKAEEDDVTRRTLRSRNVVVVNNKFGRGKLRVKKGMRGVKASTLVLAAKLRLRQRAPKGEPTKRELRRPKSMPSKCEEAPKNGGPSKNGDAKPSVLAKNNNVAVIGKDVAAGAKPTSWEEELFKYKYSLRMPVKLINISRPPNWPKSNGGSSSLPDLDRKETDSDLLNDVKQQKTPKKRSGNSNASRNNNLTASNSKIETKFSNTKEFKDSVRFLQEKFDQKIEEKSQTSGNLAKLMMEKKMKIIPKSSDGPELLPTPSLDGFRSKLAVKASDASKKDDRRKDSSWNAEVEDEDVVEDSLIGYFRKETVDVFKEVFEKHNKGHNQFKTVILESRTRTQTKELKHDATLKRVFGLDRPASAPPIPEANQDTAIAATPGDLQEQDVPKSVAKEPLPNGLFKPWKNIPKFRLLVSDVAVDSDRDSKDFDKDSKDFDKDSKDFDKDSKDFEETVVDFECREEDAKDTNEPVLRIVKKRTFRRKGRSSGFDYIRKKKKHQKKEEDDDAGEEKEKKKPAVYVRPIAESMEDIQNEIKTWVVNKGIGETVLHKAARLGYLDISSYCLEKLNCLPSPTDNAGYTPLHEACTRGHLNIANILLRYGADVSASARGGIRPLHEAVENGDIEVVRLLLSYGADPMLSTYAGQTPLSLVKDDRDDLKEFLLLYLADIQGNPSKPWPLAGYGHVDSEEVGYNALGDAPSPTIEELDPLEIEISEFMLPNLYKFREEYDYWVLCSDLPIHIRDLVTKRAQEQNPPPYIVRKINRVDFEANVESAMLLDDKYLRLHNPKMAKCHLVTLVKYTEKLMSILGVEKISMSFS